MVGDSDGQLKKQTSMFLLLGKNDGGWCVCYAKVHSQLYATANITAQLNATMCASASASASASAAASASASKNTPLLYQPWRWVAPQKGIERYI